MNEISKQLVCLALKEDIGSGDITTKATIPDGLVGEAAFVAREELVVCGQEIVSEVFREVDPALVYLANSPDGTKVSVAQELGRVRGKISSILTAERTALNFLQRLSGISTITAKFVSQLKGLSTKVLDTRKTTPGWRELEKYAVSCGGGVNHRFGLYDRFLIKNNHVDALSGDIALAIRTCKKYASDKLLEVEVRNQKELNVVLPERPDIILLDNMSVAEVRESVKLIRAFDTNNKIIVEASGGINLSNVRAYAEALVDAVSIGAITHSAPAVDISLRYQRGS